MTGTSIIICKQKGSTYTSFPVILTFTIKNTHPQGPVTAL